jgi:hypothetical protein
LFVLIYDITVDDEPRPRVPSDDVMLGKLFFLDGRRSGGFPSFSATDGGEGAIFRDLPVSVGIIVRADILCTGDEGCGTLAARTIEFGKELETRGAILSEFEAVDHRSRTEGFPGLVGFALSPGVGDPPAPVAILSIWELTLTILWTKPRPFSLLKLGVRSFCAAGRKNAGDGLWEGIIFGPCGDTFGTGCIGRAREGVVMGDFLEDGGVERDGRAIWRGVNKWDIVEAEGGGDVATPVVEKRRPWGVIWRFSGVFGRISGVFERSSGVFERNSGVFERNSGVLVRTSGVLECRSGVLERLSGVLERDSGVLGRMSGVFERLSGVRDCNSAVFTPTPYVLIGVEGVDEMP